MKKLIVDHVLPLLLCAGFRLWCLTFRVYDKGHNDSFNGRSYIFTLWHSRIFYILYHFRRQTNAFLLISPSKDGNLLANVGRLLGYSIIRGSSFKKTVSATRSIIKGLRDEQIIFVVADGSRGPRHKAQTGFLQLAAMTGTPVVPMSWNAENKIEFNSWDRFVLPLPFTRINLNIGDPIQVPEDPSEGIIQKKKIELETTLNRLTFEKA